jgi:hypothetical protein
MRPSTAIAPAAMSTTLTLFAFSVAMKKNATRKMPRARMPVTAGVSLSLQAELGAQKRPFELKCGKRAALRALLL